MELPRRKFLHLAAGAAALPVASRIARAQTYPSRPITIVIGYTAGGPTDTRVRILAQHMRATLGQSVIVENMTGASGSLAIARVGRAVPDGYTLSSGDWGTHVVNGAINRSKMPHKEGIHSLHNSESSGSFPMQPAASQLIPMAARLALWGGRELAGLTLVSLFAGTATIPYIAYHFHRISPFAVVANLLAMPVVSGWAMPWALLGSSSAFADFFNPSSAPPP